MRVRAPSDRGLRSVQASGVLRRTLIGSFDPRRPRTAAVYARACSIEREAGFVNTDMVFIARPLT